MNQLHDVSVRALRTDLAALVLALLGSCWGVQSAQGATIVPLRQGDAAVTTFSGLQIPGSPSPIDPNGPVVTTLNIQDPADNPPGQGATLGRAWLGVPFHQDPRWIAANLGQVFGIALDDKVPPNIYVTASSVYLLHVNATKTAFESGMYGFLGPGGVYQIDGTTGAICSLAVLPNQGAGLGNIAYDRVHKQLFVSDFEDGRIYRLLPKTSCFTLDLPQGIPFDHGLALPNAVPPRPAIPNGGPPFDLTKVGIGDQALNAPMFFPGFTPRGRRVWGVQVFDNRLYYSVWTTDVRDKGTSPPPNEIWSVALDGKGDFNTQDVRLEKTIPPLAGLDYSNPVSDIAFSAKGKMLVAERVRNRDYGISAAERGTQPLVLDAHDARVLEFTIGGATNEVPQIIYVGNFVYMGVQHANSAGGADYGYGYADRGATVTCDDTVAAMGDALRVGNAVDPVHPNDTLRVYGLQLGPAAGNSPNLPLTPTSVGESSYFIDLMFGLGRPGPPSPGYPDFKFKTQMGSVVIERESCGQSAPACLTAIDSGQCTGNGDYLYTFQVTNLSTTNVSHLIFVDLSPAATVTPNDVSFANEPGGFLAPGKTSALETVLIQGAPPGPLTFRFLLLDQTGAECCAVSHSLPIPACNCAQVLTSKFACSIATGYDYTFTLQDLRKQPPISYVLLTATTPGLVITQSGEPITPPLNDNDKTTQTVNFSGAAAVPGATVCFQLSVHDTTLTNCCAITRCEGPLFPCSVLTLQPDLNLSLNTGLGSVQAGLAGGKPQAIADPSWTVIEPSPHAPAQSVLAPDSDWPWAIPESAWISRDASAASVAGAPLVRYRRCFCIGAGAREATLDVALWADDRASLLLNGQRIAGPGGNYAAAKPLSVHLKGAVGSGGPFATGNNCLVAVVHQSGNTTGLDLFGSIQAAGGACTSPP